MLNHAKLLSAFEQVAPSLFKDISHEYELARAVWQSITSDATFVHKVKKHLPDAAFPVPTWQGPLDACFPVAPLTTPYRVLSVDGSQIYPDRHQGNDCFLINIGTVQLHYGGCAEKPVVFDSIPYLFTGDDEASDGESSTDLVNCRRQEFEFTHGVQLAQKVTSTHKDQVPLVLLFDGSLIFWHLEAKNPALAQQFLSRYCAALYALYHDRVLTASYISLPKSRELSNLLRLAMSDFNADRTDLAAPIAHVGDMAVAHFFLQPYTRSTVFQNHASVTKQYPDVVKPFAFYLHTGEEIGRVEIPAWVAHDEALVDTVARVVLDQSRKGRGYPVALAEAHEQAVVKGPDRDFFYHLLNKVGIENKQRMVFSQKSLKKRGMGI